MKKIISLMFAASLVISLFSSCIGKKVEPATDNRQEISSERSMQDITVPEYLKDESEKYTSLYEEKLETIYSLMIGFFSGDALAEYMDNEEFTGLWEAVGTELVSLRSIGYLIDDISADNIPELIITVDRDDGTNNGTEILNIYGTDGENVRCILSGSTRSSWYILDSGELYFTGNAGIGSDTCATYVLSRNASETECEKFYFTMPGQDGGDVSCYMNPNGTFGTDAEGTCIVSAEEYSTFVDKCTESEKILETESLFNWGMPEISVEYSDNIGDLPGEVTEYIVESSEYSVKVVFFSENEIRNLSLLSVFAEDIDESGKVTYSKQNVKSFESLSNPLVAELAFYGDMPNNGFSAEDRFGNVISFVIGQSGNDGSLYTEPVA